MPESLPEKNHLGYTHKQRKDGQFFLNQTSHESNSSQEGKSEWKCNGEE